MNYTDKKRNNITNDDILHHKEFEVWYHINYFLEKSLIAIKDILEKDEYEIKKYSNPCVYYHIKVEQMLCGCDQIINYINKGADLNILQLKVDDFPLLRLADGTFRNFFMHIDDRNENFVYKYGFVGGFNVINSSDKNDQYFNNVHQNVALDLVNKMILIKDVRKKANGRLKDDEIKVLNIISLEKELKNIKTINGHLENKVKCFFIEIR